MSTDATDTRRASSASAASRQPTNASASAERGGKPSSRSARRATCHASNNVLARDVGGHDRAARAHPDRRQQARREADAGAFDLRQRLVARAPRRPVAVGRQPQRRPAPGERLAHLVDEARLDLAHQQVEVRAGGEFDVHLQVEVAEQVRQQRPATGRDLERIVHLAAEPPRLLVQFDVARAGGRGAADEPTSERAAQREEQQQRKGRTHRGARC